MEAIKIKQDYDYHFAHDVLYMFLENSVFQRDCVLSSHMNAMFEHICGKIEVPGNYEVDGKYVVSKCHKYMSKAERECKNSF